MGDKISDIESQNKGSNWHRQLWVHGITSTGGQVCHTEVWGKVKTTAAFWVDFKLYAKNVSVISMVPGLQQPDKPGSSFSHLGKIKYLEVDNKIYTSVSRSQDEQILL